MTELEAACSYFEGGYAGVLERFARGIRAPILRLPLSEAQELSEYLGITERVLSDIPDNPEKYFQSETIQSLATFFRANLRDWFKVRRDLTVEEKQCIMAEAAEYGLVQAKGADSVPWSEADQLSLFLILRVLSLLEAQQASA